jgi:LPXTG-site transpeptidase (sortase) family protein
MTPRTAVALLASATALGATNAHAATINIPAIHVHQHVTANVNQGPAWWPGTHRPGQQGTVAVAGHRTTHTRPFHDLDKLKRGDRIYVRYAGRVHVYVMTGRQVISSRNQHIADDIGHERLILTACARADGTPTSLAYRIVIYALPKEPT